MQGFLDIEGIIVVSSCLTLANKQPLEEKKSVGIKN